MSNDCRYPDKHRYDTEDDARAGADEIRTRVFNRGQRFVPLYPYICPSGKHWHLSSSRQGRATCPRCDATEIPAWFDNSSKQWVIYAHGDCPIQGGVKAVSGV